jgi:hypothetical protein
VLLVWLVAYARLGYGVTGSGLYVDPVQRPLLFLHALVERWPVLLAGQWLQLPTDAWLLLPSSARIGVAIASAALVSGLAALLWPVLNRPVARFWAIGMCLSIVPVCAAFPMDRLLLFPGLGAFGLLGLLADTTLLASHPSPLRHGRAAAVTLLVLHGPIAAVLLTGRTLALPAWGDFFTAAVHHGPAEPAIAMQTWVFVNGNDFPVTYSRMVPVANAQPAPRRVAQLASMMDSNLVYREDRNTLVVTPRSGFLAHPIDSLLANPDRRFTSGESIDRQDYRAVIVRVTRDGRPASVSFRFRRPLEHPSYRWLCWKDRRLQSFDLPQVGSTVVIPGNTLSAF